MKRLRKFEIFLMVLIVVVVTSIIVIQKRYIPESKAEESTGKTIRITFSSGDKNGVFESITKTLGANINSGYVTLPESFKDTININKESYFSKVDDETYYFLEGDYSYTFTGWKIKGATQYIPMETVFQPGDVVNYDTLNVNNDETLELEAIWGKVIYAENEYTGRYYTDYWIYDKEYTEQNYTASGAWNYKYENNILTLNKGKNVDEPICSLDYAYFLLYNDSQNPDINNAYLNVLMLKDDLDYIKGNANSNGQINFFTTYETYINNRLTAAGFTENKDNYIKTDTTYNCDKHYIWGEYTAQTNTWGYVTNKYYNSSNDRYYKTPCYTFKSVNSKNYVINWNAYGYSDQMVGNIRFDGAMFRRVSNTGSGKRPVKISPTTVSSETSFYGYIYNYIEFTNRTVAYSEYVGVLRPGSTQTVVVNGGKFDNWQTSWATSIKSSLYEIHWYMGNNAYINGTITLGTTENRTNAISIDIPIELTITGGTVINNIYGASTGIANNDYQTRKINIIGDKGNNTKTNPHIVGSIYGAGNQAKLTGDTYVNIVGSTQIAGSVYGGGYNFNATLYGNTNVNIENSYIKNNVFAGGYNGNIAEDSNGNGGNTNLSIKYSSINGNIWGVGMGGTQSSTIQFDDSASNSTYNWKTTNFLPSDKFFTSGRNSYYKDAKDDWSWSKPATGFPFLITDETSPYYGYVCASTTKYISWTSNSADYLNFGRYRTLYYLSLAYVKNNVNIKIDGSTIGDSTNGKGNIYGGGSIAVVYGDVDINISKSTVYGNIYGGGDGTAKPEAITLYKPLEEENYVAPTYTYNASTGNVSVKSESIQNSQLLGKFNWSNDKSLLEEDGIDYTNKLVYSPNTEGLGSVSGDVKLNISNTNVNGIVYGGGNAGTVIGSIDITMNGVTINNNIYGGGYSGNVNGNIKITIPEAQTREVFGGGYSGTVLGDSEIIIEKGTFTNIFGGGDQSYIQGNTNVTIGKENSANSLVVTGLVYGGGRGYDANNDGDASDFTTVYGSSNVLIQGINTKVENYGSTKLGAVAGNVDVNFKDYWSGNSTAKYKTMNGIDRATTVSFDNSYVLLENKDSNGNLVGIQSIENLIIPKGSGLKISANGEITGNFEGGGELYLDSLVCLTVQGDITGQTTLVLNPKLMEDGVQKIRGGINVPYLKVAGTATTDQIALVSGESNKYVIIQADKQTVQEKVGENYIYYYIAEDIVIKNDIIVTSNSIEGRKYNEDITNTNETLITNNETFSADIKTTYYLTNDAYSTKDYTNISRKLKLISNLDEKKDVIIPIGTEITMIVNGDYYYYRVEKDNIAQINLSDFVNSVSNNKKFNELTDITNSNLVDKTTNEINGTTSYSFKENYKFIFNFENSNGIEKDRYYPSLEIYYGKTSFENEKKDVANNIVDIQKRTYECNLENNREYYESDGKIEFLGNIKIGGLKENTYIKSKDLYLQIKIKDDNSNDIEIPQGTQITINDNKYSVKNGKCEAYFLDNLGTNSIDNELNITLDMSEVLPQDRISKGNYKFILSYLNGKQYENILEKDITIIEKQDEYGIKTEINEDISNNQIQLIENDKDENRSIKVQYVNSSEFKNMKIKIMAVERTGEFEYKETNNSKNKISIDVSEIDLADQTNVEQDINIIFNKNINSGTYRILVGLYDEFDDLKTFDYVNFIVE